MRVGWRQVGCVLALGAILGCQSDPQRVAEGKPDGAVAAPTPAPRARLKQVAGSVNVKRAAGDDWIVAREGMELFENDKVRTASGGSVVVDTPNGSVTVGEDALVAIPEDRGDVTLLQGHVDARTDASRKTLIITTPAAEVRAGREIFIQ